MTTQSVLVCSAFSTSSDGTVTTCTSQQWVESYVVSPDQQAQLDLLTQGGFDSDSFQLFFGGTLTMFAVGFSIGLVISQIRKLKRGV